MSLPGPIVSLSDEILTTLVQMCRPLTPPARIAFLEALAVLLREEPQQPPGDGTVCRHARELLRSGSTAANEWRTKSLRTASASSVFAQA